MTALELTLEQRVLLTAVAHGASHQQLARERGISRPAISKQLHRARLRLGAETVTHAVHLATRAGLIPDAVVGAAVGPVDASEAPGPHRSAAVASGAPQAHGNAHRNPNATKEIH